MLRDNSFLPPKSFKSISTLIMPLFEWSDLLVVVSTILTSISIKVRIGLWICCMYMSNFGPKEIAACI